MKKIRFKNSKWITMILVISMVVCNVFNVFAFADEEDAPAKEYNDTILEDPEDAEEFMAEEAEACWTSLPDALNYYIGKGKWSYTSDRKPYAAGFTIVASNGYCTITRDDVTYSFYYGY